MASNYVSREEVEERIQCLICHHRLENPKQLPCTHSYCLVCIRRIFRGNRISCPCCKAVSEIPQDGAECLPDDHYANALIDLIHPTTGRQNTASFYPALTCSSHRRPRDIYCHTCEQPICYQCLRRHEDHQHDSLADVVDNRKRELQGMFRVTDEPKHRISDNITHLRQLEGRFEQELQATKAEINERARRQSQLIETQRATLIRDLERRCSKQLEEIRQTREEWQTSLRAIDNCEYYANDLLKNSNQVGFVIHEKDIKEKLQRICSVPIPIHRTQSKRYLKFTSNEDSLKKSTSEDLGHCRDCTSFSFPAKYRQKLTFPSGTTRPSLRNPYDVTINHQNNDILVSDNGGCALHRFDQYGAFIASVIPKMSPEEVREFDPKGVLVTRNQKVIVSDCRNNRILIIDFKGNIDKIINGISEPIGIALNDEKGFVYAVSYGEHCIKIYSLQGRFQQAFGSFGSGEGQFNHPMFIAISGNKKQLAVTDNDNHRVQILDSAGKYRFSITHCSDSDNLTYPRGVAIDTQNSIYVTSEKGIHVYSEDGLYLNQVSMKQAGIRSNYFGVAVTKRIPSKLIAADHYNRLITVYEREEDDVIRAKAIQSCDPGTSQSPRRNLLNCGASYDSEVRDSKACTIV